MRVRDPAEKGRRRAIDRQRPPRAAACFHPVCRSADLVDGEVVGVRLLGVDWAVARIDGAPRRRSPTAARTASAPLSAGCVVDGTIECAVPRLPLRRRRPLRLDPRPRRRRRRSRPRRRPCRRTRVVERYGLVWLAPERAASPASSTCPSGTTRPSSSRPLPDQTWPAGRGPDGRQLPRPRPPPVHSTPRRSVIPTTSRCPPTRSSATAGVHVRLRATRPSCSPTRWAPSEFEVARRAARRGGTSARSRSGCASSTRPTTSC